MSKTRRRLRPRAPPRVGRPAHLRLSGRRHQRLPRRARPRRRTIRVRPGAARGDGRVHGVRAREVHRRGRRLPGDLRAGRDPPAERPLRREARPPAGASRSSASRRATALGGDYQQEVDLAALFKDVAASTCRRRCTRRRSRHLVDRAMRIALVAADGDATLIVPERRAGGEGGRAPPREHGAVHSSVGYVAAARRPDRRGPRARPRTC